VPVPAPAATAWVLTAALLLASGLVVASGVDVEVVGVLDAVLFGLVIVVLLLRPAGLFAWGRRTRVERV